MRIIFIRSNPVSPYPRLEKTVNSLKKKGHEVHVLAWDRSQKYKKKEEILHLPDGDVNITRVGIPSSFGGGFRTNLFPLLKFQFEIIMWLFRNRKSYDAIHAYDFDTGFTAMICAKILNKILIYDIPDYYVDSHNLSGTKIGHFIKKAENTVINKANAVIICSEKRIQQIAGTQPKNLTIIHNSPLPYTLSDNCFAFNGSSKKLKIVYVGILSEGRFIKEIADTVIKRDDCEFHIGGFGKLHDYFQDLSKKHDSIFYYGKLPYQQTLALEKSCDVITAIYDPKVPNHNYAAPNKFYEALMLGKPLIMVRNTGMDDIVEKYGIGEVIEYSTNSLNEAIERLISKRSEWSSMSQIAKKLYNEKYSWTIMEDRLVELYNKLSFSPNKL